MSLDVEACTPRGLMPDCLHCGRTLLLLHFQCQPIPLLLCCCSSRYPYHQLDTTLIFSWLYRPAIEGFAPLLCHFFPDSGHTSGLPLACLSLSTATDDHIIFIYLFPAVSYRSWFRKLHNLSPAIPPAAFIALITCSVCRSHLAPSQLTTTSKDLIPNIKR